jgi:hypothetical protein
MTNANQKFESHEFDEVSEARSNPAQHLNGNGKTSTTPILTELQEDDDLTPEEEQQLAGFNPATPQLISEEYRLKQDQEGAVERPLAERASIRLGSVVAVVGTVMGTGAVLWFGFLQPRPPARQVTQSPSPTPTTPPTFDETAELKSRLAFQDQQQQLQPESVAQPESSPPPRPAASRSPVPAPTPAAVSPPVTVSRPEPVVIRSPVAPPERIQPVERIDPFQRWAQLANVGQLRVSSGAMEPSRSASSNLPDAPSNPVSPANQQAPIIPVVSIGGTETDSSTMVAGSDMVPNSSRVASPTELRSASRADMTPGMIGILNRTPVSQLDQRTGGLSEVALGTSTRAKVILPMIWDEGGDTSTGRTASPSENRFAVELTEDMKATNESVALPAGTILVVRTQSVGRGNNLVSASAIAIVYRDRAGQIRQQTLPPDSLQIRGQDNQPLVAQRLNDVGPDIARQNLLIGLLSSLGRVGGIINQPRTQSSTVSSGGGFNQSVITTSAEPQIWAAALEGFFNPIAERMSQRSDQNMQELLQRPNVQFVSEGTEVSVVVNSFLRVSR